MATFPHRFIACLLLCLGGAALAQNPAAKAPAKPAAVADTKQVIAPLELQATLVDGKPFDLAQLRGKVVMVFYWSTNCGICRSHLPELRANLAGWKNKPFALVTVNVDAKTEEWRNYLSISANFKGIRPIEVHAAMENIAKLPLTLVLDKAGRTIERHEGRIAPEAWDAVAEQLP